MNEQQFNELLKKLKIPTNNRSYADIFDLLDAKLSEYLDRQDAASQELIDDIQDALDYAEIKKNEVGSGIALKRDDAPKSENKTDLGELRKASEKALKEKEQVESANGQVASQGQQAAPQPQTQSQNIADQQAGKLWFSSITGADNINTMFFQALDDLKYGEFDHAKSIFEAILQVEPNNASAYLGKLMAIHQLKELRNIGNSYDKDLFTDINMRRAYDHGNAQQKKYLDDAKKEVESGKKYKEADRLALDGGNETAVTQAAKIFEALGNYRDAAQRKVQCEDRVKDIKYSRALTLNKTAWSAQTYRDAAKLYREVSGYKNADTLAAECEEMAKRRDEEEAEEKRKDELKASFLRLKKNFEEEEKTQRVRCEGKINTCAPSTEDLTRCLDAMKKFAEEHPEVNIVADAMTHISKAEEVIKEIAGLAKDLKDLNSMKKREGKSDAFWILLTIVVLLAAGLPAGFGYEAYPMGTYLPIHVTDSQMVVYDAKAPYLISFSEFETLYLSGSDSVKTLVFPNAELTKVTLRNGDYSHLKLPDTVTDLTMEGRVGSEVSLPENLERLTMRDLTVEEWSGYVFEKLTVPSQVKDLTLSNFSIGELTLPEGLETLKMEGISRLKDLVVPSTVTECTITNAEHASITFKEGMTGAVIDGCNGLTELNLPSTMHTLVLKNAPDIEVLTIPEGTVSVTISNCENLSTITMPSTLKEIKLEGTMSFEGIAFPENVQMIYIYYNDTLKNVVYSEDAAVVIRGCENLEDVEG